MPFNMQSIRSKEIVSFNRQKMEKKIQYVNASQSSIAIDD